MFGLGWGLVAAGLVLWVRDDRAAGWLSRRFDQALIRVAAGRRRVRETPRKVLAAWTMGAGIVSAPTGVMLFAGAGVALAVAAVLLIALSLLLGWGA